MKARSSLLCACVIAMLTLSDDTFGTVIPNGGITEPSVYGSGSAGSGCYASDAYAQANSSEPYSTASGGGWNEMCTDTAGYFSWGYTIYASGSFSLSFGPPSSTVYGAGGGSASAGGPFGSDNVSASISLSDTRSWGSYAGYDDPPGSGEGGYDYFSAYQTGVSSSHSSFAAASVTLPSGGTGSGSGSASAGAGMW